MDDGVDWVQTPAPYEPGGTRGSRRQFLLGALLGAVVVGALVIGGPADPGPVSTESEAGRQLLRFVPADIRASCSPRPAPGGTIALVACADGDVLVRYTLFPDAAAMDRAFDRSRLTLGLAGGDCAVDAAATGIVSSPGSGRSGRILCYQRTGSSHLRWTVESLLVSAQAMRPDVGDLTLYRWWASAAGPVDSARQAPELRGPPLGSVPDGRYTGLLFTLELADRRSGLAAADRGRWTLELLEGRYRIVGPPAPRSPSVSGPSRIDHGTYVFAKYGKLVVDPDGEIAAGPDACRETFRFRWTLRGSTLVLTAVSDPCSAYPFTRVLSGPEWTSRPARAGRTDPAGASAGSW